MPSVRVSAQWLRERLTARRVAARITTVVAGLLVLAALVVPDDLRHLRVAAFLRLPLEALVGVALVVALAPRAPRVRRSVSAAAGALLGVLVILRVLDLGFHAVLGRPFNPVLDWPLFGSTMDFATGSVGRAGALAALAGAVLLAVGLPVLLAFAVRRVAEAAARHRTGAVRLAVPATAAWTVCAVLGTQLVPGVPVASDAAAALAWQDAGQVRAGLRDRAAFRAEASVDAFRGVPGRDLLTALRGKDVVVAFVESYGRDAVADPEFAPQVGAVLDDGTRRLAAAGFGARSAFLTSPTAGGGSWLAHATLLSGLWIDNQRRFRDLVASDRLTLPSAFRLAGQRTVAVMPGTDKPWPERRFYGYQQVYDAGSIGYRGRPFSWISSAPDQVVLASFERAERTRAAGSGRPPVMAEIDLTSSHEPWAPLPRLVDWRDVDDTAAFDAMTREGDPPNVVWRDPTRIRTQYRRSIEYSLGALVSYVERYGDDDLVLVFLGDHQPAPIVTGPDASRDVPVTIVARDRAVLDRISGWGWQDGLRPDPQAPVWKMNAFRDRFLTAFGSRPASNP